jgi:dienelactone hydrolase
MNSLNPDQGAKPMARRAVLLSGLALPAGLLFSRAARATGQQAAPSPTPVPSPTPTPSPSPGPSTQLTLPPPTGPLRLGTTSLHLVDASRPDPWVPTIPFRELMTQIWYPAHAVDGYPLAPYFTPATARAYEQLQHLPLLNWPVTGAHTGAPVRQIGGGWPVVLYSHGLQGDREEATQLVEDLASHGYIVVTIDHIHDADVVELPDGHVETSALPGDDLQTTIKAVSSRAADVSFVLDQLAVIGRGGNPGHEQRPLPRGLGSALDLSRTGMFGFSDGGATTAHAMNVDARIKAGVDMDGTFWTPQAQAGSNGALLLFGEQDLDPFQATTWSEFWASQRGPKLEILLQGSKHLTFTVFAALLPQVASILGWSQGMVIEGIGTINGDRAVAVERAYIKAWFDTYLRHRHSHLLTGPSPRYPEIQFTVPPPPAGGSASPGRAAIRSMRGFPHPRVQAR